jgi:hypothetical protein
MGNMYKRNLCACHVMLFTNTLLKNYDVSLTLPKNYDLSYNF